MTNREFITIQLGNFSNHVGAHWWNSQQALASFREFGQSNVDELGEGKEDKDNRICHDVLWRSGENSKGEVTAREK